jgi:hypothetical protein
MLLTSGSEEDGAPVWMPNGKSIVFRRSLSPFYSGFPDWKKRPTGEPSGALRQSDSKPVATLSSRGRGPAKPRISTRLSSQLTFWRRGFRAGPLGGEPLHGAARRGPFRTSATLLPITQRLDADDARNYDVMPTGFRTGEDLSSFNPPMELPIDSPREIHGSNMGVCRRS